MEKKKLINLIVYIATIIIAISFLACFLPNAKKVYNDRFFAKYVTTDTYKVKVLEIIDEYQEVDSYEEESMVYIYRCKVLEGPEEKINTEIEVMQRIEDRYNFKYRKAIKGNIIYISHIGEWNKTDKYPLIEWEFTGISMGFDRTTALIVLVVLFVIVIIAFSRFQGFNTLIALILSLAVVFIVLIPKILLGANIYIWTVICFFYVVAITLLLVIGFNQKALCAFLGCLGGIIVIGVLTLIVRGAFSLTGNYNDTTFELYLLSNDYFDVKLDLQALIFSMITLGSLGALLDVAISLSSSLFEISSKAESAKEIVKSGFVIGKDMLGTMTNTLILAYLGTSLPLVLYDILYFNFETIKRLEVITIEIIQSLVGTLGMLSAIPVTSFVCAFIYYSFRNKTKNRAE